MIYVQLKSGLPESRIVELNEMIKKFGGDISHTPFITDADTKAWLDDINLNKKSPQAHLKPKDRDLSLEELKYIFPDYTKTGLMCIDVKYSRCTNEMAEAILMAMDEWSQNATYTDGEMSQYVESVVASQGDIDKFKLIASENEREHICSALDRFVARHITPVEAVPTKNENRREPIQGGIATFSDWNRNDVVVLFGNVDHPMFMKDDEFVEDEFNPLYKDDAGRHYMLLPLLRVDSSMDKQLGEIYSQACEIGLRVHPSLLYLAVYNVPTQNFNKLNADLISERDLLFALLRVRSSIGRPVSMPEPLNYGKGRGLMFPEKDLKEDNKVLVMVSLANTLLKKDFGDAWELRELISRKDTGWIVDRITQLSVGKELPSFK